jgi:hypothetical protein
MAMKVKGSLFIFWVKAIKANKTGVYDKYLSNKDREIISERILPNIWYPFETYQNCVTAVFEVVANKNLEVVTEWGRMSSRELMTGLYGGTLDGLTPVDYLKKIGILHRTFFNFSKIESVIESKNQALFKLIEFEPLFSLQQYMVKGWIEGILSLCGAKDVRSEIITKSWEGAPFTSIRFTWT